MSHSHRFAFGFEKITSERDGCQSLKVSVLFQDLQVGVSKVLRHKRQLWGHWVYIAALRLEDDSLLVVATQTAPKSAIADYAKRWGIETLFGVFKTRGFCLESTHLTDTERLSKLKRTALISFMLGIPHRQVVTSTQATCAQETWAQS